MINSTVSTCPTWCEQHTTEEGVTYHEANVEGGPWDLILNHEATSEGTSVSVGLKRDPLAPSEAFALGVALIEAATTIGQAEAEQESPSGAGLTQSKPDSVRRQGRNPIPTPFADLLAGELRRGGWNLSPAMTTQQALVRAIRVQQRVSSVLTDAELARRAGMSPSALSKRLSGNIRLDLDDVARLADALGVDPFELMDAGRFWSDGVASVASLISNEGADVPTTGVAR